VLKRIEVNQLTVGMFIHGFDAGWLEHPFWRERFLIKEPSRLQEIQKSGLRHCWIDVSKGRDVSVEMQHGSTAEPASSDAGRRQHQRGRAGCLSPPP
jgi:hypothetical protein